MKNTTAAALKLSVSPGNRKMGAIPSVSLPPVKTCTNCAVCAGKCYAARMVRRFATVRNAYENNLALYAADPEAFFFQAKAAAMISRFFRWHVSGDIPNADYFRRMVQLAEDLPSTSFLCFTKNYSVVNSFIDNGGAIPENLHVIFSAWGKQLIPDNPHGLPVSDVIFKGETPADDWKICGGNCFECCCRGVGCWELKPGETIAFYEH